MKKVQIFAMAALLAFGLASCNNGETPVNKPGSKDGKVGYLSINVEMADRTRASSEDAGTAQESNLYSLYLVTFDASGQVLANPGTGGGYYIYLNSNMQNIPAQKVSASARGLLAVANPGPELLAALNSLMSTSTFDSFNEAIAGIDIHDIVGDTTTGFAMISSGKDTDADGDPLAVDATITTPLVELTEDDIYEVEDGDVDEVVAGEAEDNPVDVKIERLASKAIFIAPAHVPSILAATMGSDFAIDKWTVDAVNTTYFPFAVKTILEAAHTSDLNGYVRNFYTEDPNYNNMATWPAPGIEYASVGEDFVPVLPWEDYYGWKDALAPSIPTPTPTDANIAYLVENTLAAAAQKFGNATRIVIKGTYTPKDYTPGADWFSWAGKNYESFAELKAAYAEGMLLDPGTSPLVTACDAFFDKLEDYLTPTVLDKENFAALEASDLALVPDKLGGEVVKDGDIPVIRWYQGGQSYYWYEVRHNNEANGTMDFSKYGAVRNNWYNMTLNSVSQPGTPWYPDINDPGPGDPDPDRDIDEGWGYIGVDVSAQPWILWEHSVDL